MSMNLHCDEMELWQTPTYITYMCLYINKNKKGFYLQDPNWKNIRFRYIEWVKSHLNGTWKTDEELFEARNEVEKHINKLMAFKRLHFYIM